MTIDTTKLRELAQAATPGPWYSKWPEERCVWKDIGPGRYPVAYTGDCFDGAPNAEYIAAVNPATVLALLDEVEKQKSRADILEETVHRLQQYVILSPTIDKDRVGRDQCSVSSGHIEHLEVHKKGRKWNEVAMKSVIQLLAILYSHRTPRLV